MKRALFQFPVTIWAPANVEVTIDGILAIVEIIINLHIFIGHNPAIYVKKSLGVPGIKNNIKKINSIFWGFWNNLLPSIFFS